MAVPNSFFLLLVALILVAAHAARLPPADDKTLQDQKNVFSFTGTYGGVGPTGIPYGGVAGAAGSGGVVGGPPLRAIGGFLGTGPTGRFTAVGGAIPGGIVTVGGNTGGVSFQPNP